MHKNSNMRNKQIEINTCKNIADSCLNNESSFLISRIRASHWKATPSFRENGYEYGIRFGREGEPGDHHYLVHRSRHLCLGGDSSSWKIVRISSYVCHDLEFNNKNLRNDSFIWRPYFIGARISIIAETRSIDSFFSAKNQTLTICHSVKIIR